PYRGGRTRSSRRGARSDRRSRRIRSPGAPRARRIEPAVRRRRHRPAPYRGRDADADRRHLRADAADPVGAVADTARPYDLRGAAGPGLPAVQSTDVRAGRFSMPDDADTGYGDRGGRARTRMNAEKVWPAPSSALGATAATSRGPGWAETSGDAVLPSDPLERAACLTLLAFAGAMQV